jgi:hypothetical protein
MATLGLKKMGLLNWDSQQGRPFSLPSQRNFPISFKPKVAIADFFGKMQRKTWYSILGLDAMPLSLKNLLLRKIFLDLMFDLRKKNSPIWGKTRIFDIFWGWIPMFLSIFILFQIKFPSFPVQGMEMSTKINQNH